MGFGGSGVWFWGLGFEFWGFGLGVWGLGLGVLDLGFGVGCWVWVFGAGCKWLEVWGPGVRCRVQGCGL